MPERIYYPYDEFRVDLKTLVTIIDKPFDAILGIARGGLSIAQMLGEYYDLRAVYAINTIGYDETVIVDDIVDSGDTLFEVLALLKDRYPHITFYSASLFYKKTAKIAPNWYVKEPAGWIDFFWTVDLRK